MSSCKRIVICGGGAIGAAIAYFTSRRGARPRVIERHEVAGAASGKSGGFLALDWCRGSPLDLMARRSFEVRSASGAVRGAALASGEIVEGDAVVIAMGPWSILAARWLPLPAVLGSKGHSLVLETGEA